MEFLDVRFVGGDRRVDVGGHPQGDAVDRPTTANTRIKCMVYVYVSLHGKSGKESAHPWTQIEPSGRLPKLLPSPEDRKQSFNLNFFSSRTRLSTPVCSDGHTNATKMQRIPLVFTEPFF